MYTYRLKNSRKLFFLDGAKVISDGVKVFFLSAYMLQNSVVSLPARAYTHRK